MLAAAKCLLQNEGESLRKCFESYPVRVCPAHKLSLQGFKFYDESWFFELCQGGTVFVDLSIKELWFVQMAFISELNLRKIYTIWGDMH